MSRGHHPNGFDRSVLFAAADDQCAAAQAQGVSSPNDRNAATLARWIIRTRPDEVHVPHVQRKVRLPGLKTADTIHAAAAVLVEADWLMLPPSGAGSTGRGRAVYTINPRVWEAQL